VELSRAGHDAFGANFGRLVRARRLGNQPATHEDKGDVNPKRVQQTSNTNQGPSRQYAIHGPNLVYSKEKTWDESSMISHRIIATAVTAGCIFGATASNGQSFGSGLDLYVSGGLGTALTPDSNLTAGDGAAAVPVELGIDNGSFAHVALGARLGNGFRAEVELGASSSDFDGTGDVSGGGSLDTEGSVDVTTLMFNGIYDVEVADNLGFFVGAGIGAARIDVDLRRGPLAPGFIIADGSDTRFGYQVLLGATYDLSDTVEAFGRYSFTGMADRPFDANNTLGGTDTYTTFAPDRHGISFGLNVAF